MDKWKAFKWNVLCVNGHDFIELKDAFIAAKECMDRPTIIIADTVKGKGIRIAENQAEWHSRAPRDNEWEVICGDLNISLEDLKSI